ncbi:MAG: DUF5667 domain-containing protein [Candidatus Pacebacteria bacterium]|nr:DUF5667 domain-containing protein [Candidatus Paceibacterota bacterium]
MTEKELVSNLKKLKNTKPSKDWALLTREKILGKEEKNWISVLETLPRLVFQYNKLAFASVILFGFITVAFTFAQNSLPGDPVYILKKITEKSRAVFVSTDDLPQAQLGLANKRLEELTTIAQTNQVKKLAPAILEFQANAQKAAENLMSAKNPDIKKIAVETKKMEESKQKIESLGVIIGETEELDSALEQLVGRELKDLGSRTLTDEQKAILIKAGEDYWAQRYSDALEKILTLSYPQF